MSRKNQVETETAAPSQTQLEASQAFEYRCSMPEVPEPEFLRMGLHPDRLSALVVNANKWANGTVLHFCFIGSGVAEAERNVVRKAFQEWKALGIGLEFQEVTKLSEAEVRIGFVPNDGSWSYIGTEVLKQPQKSRTMNFGWSLLSAPGRDTALHEIGHTLGLPHEHQNPLAGIVWDEEAVYQALAAPPNNWSREQTHYNIIRKLPKNTVEGSNWDPDSVMHYPFEPGLIRQPAPYYNNGLRPAGGLSNFDRQWALKFYPAIQASSIRALSTGQSIQLPNQAGEQINLSITPAATRKYTIQTIGPADCALVLFRTTGGNQQFVIADDDSGEERNARVELKLTAGESYMARVRVKFAGSDESPVIMMW